MKAILISDHAKWCALMMNGIKKIEVRKENVGKAVQKLIDEQGYADIYVCCTKDTKVGLVWDNNGKGLVNSKLFPYSKGSPEHKRLINGKVVFKFRCYKVDEFRPFFHWCIEKETCLTRDDVLDYLDSKNKSVGNPKRQDKVYAIHISDLEIFDKPKEVCDFRFIRPTTIKNFYESGYLTKAPQSFCYIEVE